MELKKTQILINKPVSLGLAILKQSVIYEFWYDNVRPKYGDKQNCLMGTDSFIVGIKTDDIYKDIPGDVQRRYDTLIMSW